MFSGGRQNEWETASAGYHRVPGVGWAEEPDESNDVVICRSKTATNGVGAGVVYTKLPIYSPRIRLQTLTDLPGACGVHWPDRIEAQMECPTARTLFEDYARAAAEYFEVVD